jgi:hypothetical protein
MYKVKEQYNQSYESASKVFGTIECESKDKNDAELKMFKKLLAKVEELNKRLSNKGLLFNLRIDDRVDRKRHDLIVMCYNHETRKEVWVVAYDIEWFAADDLEKYNNKLKMEFGKNVGVEIKTKTDCDAVEYYYCEGLKSLEGIQYHHIDSAYNAAYGYLDEVERYESDWRGW